VHTGADIANITGEIEDMSGGYVDDQSGEGEHQQVVFTFIGKLDPKHVKEWNEKIADLKSKFGKQHLVGVTVQGKTTSAEYLEKQKPKEP
jgi:hypothetical protein